MDLADMQNSAVSNDGVRYLLTIIDIFSKYAIVIPIKNKKANTIAQVLDTIFDIKLNIDSTQVPYKPLVILSDNSKEFTGNEVKDVYRRYGIHQITSYPYTPLGIIERFNKTIKSKIY